MKAKGANTMKPQKLGIVYTARATLKDADLNKLGTCTDTPNAIASALRECPTASIVIGFASGTTIRGTYKNRMLEWNSCPSGFVAA